MMKPIIVPGDYDYVGAYLTNRCHLSCPYCITNHHKSSFRQDEVKEMAPEYWISGLNRLSLPKDVPVTLQGGEPFLYEGIWQILENVRHKMDILTALPSFVMRDEFLKLKTLDWNKRNAPYPTIRVSYHKNQNNYKELIERIADLQGILSIGLYYFAHPLNTDEEVSAIKEYAARFKVEVRIKDFLGEYGGRLYGTYLYPEGVAGRRKNIKVLCRNTVLPIAPDGKVYRCHSDLYFNRKELALGNILEGKLVMPESHLECGNYGLCSECDIKVKTNHYQAYGYTSVDIKF